MMSLGNYLANQVWEASADPNRKPKPTSGYEEKHFWIRSKYEEKKFLLSSPESSINSNQQLIESIIKNDIFSVYSILAARSTNSGMNNSIKNSIKNNGIMNSGVKNNGIKNNDTRSPLSVAAAHGNLAIVQLLLWVSLRGCFLSYN